MRKFNSLFKYLKNINKLIHNLLEKNLNKLKFDNLSRLVRSNKIFLTFVAVIILLLSYLSIPNIYSQSDIVKKLKIELSNKFGLEFNFINKINYKFFPRPHFITSESSIINKQNKISDINEIKIYLSLENLFKVKNINVKEVVLEGANFNLNKSNYNFFIKILDNNFNNSKFIINSGNIFYRNINNEVLFINKILKINYSYDHNELKNIFYSENEIFNLPYSFQLFNDKNKKKFNSKINIDILRFQAENQLIYDNDVSSGIVKFIYNNFDSFLDYKFKKNYFEFQFLDKSKNPKFLYNGKFNLKPFNSSFEGFAEELNLSYLFNSSALIAELLKTKIFNNENINFYLNIKANKILNFNNFVDINLNSKILEGLIDIDNTELQWKNYADLKLFDTLIYVKNGELFLDGSSKINLVSTDGIYKFLVTPKNYRKKIKHINLNFNYNFDQKIIKFKDIRIDGNTNQNLEKIFNNVPINDNELQNKIYLKKLLNEAIKSYSG